MRIGYSLVVPVLVIPTLSVAPAAWADCTSASGTTICSQGDVRGSDTGAGPGTTAGPYVPYPCDWGYYACDDLWNGGLYFNVDPGLPGRPGGPGGPGGPGIGGPGGPDFGGGGRPGGGRPGGGRR